MTLTAVTGTMRRRLLVNFRIDPAAAAAILPPGVAPKIINGRAIAGLCLVRLSHVRPLGLPRWLSVDSENVAARMAVTYDHGRQQAVLIFRRDTGSWINALVGGRMFPGVHHHAAFRIPADNHRVDITMDSRDDSHHLRVVAEASDHVMPGSAIGDLDTALTFFRGGECGYSPGFAPGVWEGVHLACHRWDLRPMRVTHIESSFFADGNLFPPGAATLDSAFIMRDIEHTWSAMPDLHWGVPRARPIAQQQAA